LVKSSWRTQILLRAPLNGYTGYGLHANQIVTDLQSLGYEFLIRAVDINETFAPIPHNVRKSVVCQEQPNEWELVLTPPGFSPLNGKRTVQFTMWESTKLPLHAIDNLNRCEAVIVPSGWNASCFCGSGVKTPIHIVPLGIKTDVFKYAPMSMRGPCIFGAAGRLESGGTRKGINFVIEAFKKAFPPQSNVRLHVKIFPDCEIPSSADPRIHFTRKYLNEQQMANWFQSLTCFVSGARGEGWGLMQHQALASGRPIISVRFGGTAEFFTERLGYALNFRLVPAEDLYTGCGLWAEPDEEHLISLMLQVYRNRKQARELGINAARSASRLSWVDSSRKLQRVLQTIGMID
jgi:glycosyltransferase involved in cell wall biosynthesis